jgi:adenine-specific DNA-methyltransferase
MHISDKFDPEASAVIYHGDCRDLIQSIPKEFIHLIITSPPYNIGKEYETRGNLEEYKEWHRTVIEQCYSILAPSGSICWEVGNYVIDHEIIPLDVLLYPIFASLGLKLRNRIVWHFRHGLHCSQRFSGRYEVILWFTKSDDYTFNLDKVRVPQLYSQKKYYKGPKKGQLSCNPKGKNPSDVWEDLAIDFWDIPNVHHNMPGKTPHPAQFPEKLVERMILATTNIGDWVLDPFLGSGTTAVAALRLGRKVIGAEINKKYINFTYDRIKKLSLSLFR